MADASSYLEGQRGALAQELSSESQEALYDMQRNHEQIYAALQRISPQERNDYMQSQIDAISAALGKLESIIAQAEQKIKKK